MSQSDSDGLDFVLVLLFCDCVIRCEVVIWMTIVSLSNYLGVKVMEVSTMYHCTFYLCDYLCDIFLSLKQVVL